ncbi:TIGR01906 family membrane protein, partial [Chloroflexota bacterium]
MKLRAAGITAQVILILCLPVLLLTTSILWAVNSSWLYEYGFDKYNISQNTGLAQSELEKAATGLIRYFNSGEEIISLAVTKDGKSFELFNEREVAHLRDVKGLIRLNHQVLLGTLIYVLGYAAIASFRRKYRRLAQGLVGGSGLTLGLILVLGVAMAFNFEQLFWQFHIISFTNELWLLDPTRDYLIMLFPSGFWFD